MQLKVIFINHLCFHLELSNTFSLSQGCFAILNYENKIKCYVSGECPASADKREVNLTAYFFVKTNFFYMFSFIHFLIKPSYLFVLHLLCFSNLIIPFFLFFNNSANSLDPQQSIFLVRVV